MIFKALKNKNVLWLSFCFALFFFGFNGAEQFLAIYYKQNGVGGLALTSLSFIYIFIVPASILAPWLVGKLGLKKSLVIPGLVYASFILLTVTKNPWLIFSLAALVGLAAGPLGTARATYLLKSAKESGTFSYGEALGTQDSLRAVGSTLGVLGVGFASKYINLDYIFLFLGIVTLLASLLFARLSEVKTESKSIPLKRLTGVIANPTYWLILPFFFSTSFVFGMSISTIPIILEKHGLAAVGVVMSIFSIGPIFLSALLGKLADSKNGTYTLPLLISALFGSIIAALILFSSDNLFLVAVATFLVTVLFSAGSSAGGNLIGRFFNEDDWETVASLVNLGALGVVVPLMTEQFFPRTQTLYLAIASCLISIIGLRILLSKKKGVNASLNN